MPGACDVYLAYRVHSDKFASAIGGGMPRRCPCLAALLRVSQSMRQLTLADGIPKAPPSQLCAEMHPFPHSDST